MRLRVARSIPIVCLAIQLFGSAIAADVEDDHWNRLRSMSRDQRLSLSEKLKEFDGLDRLEKENIRKLDDAIQKLPPQNREAAYTVLRRYHLWVETLSEAERTELDALPPDKKMERIRRLQKQQMLSPGDFPAEIHPNVFGTHSPYDMATQIRTWLALTPDRRTALSNLKEVDRGKKMNEYRQELKIQAVPKPAITAADEQFAAERWKTFKNQYNLPALKKFDDLLNVEFQEKKARRLRRMAENRIFEKRVVEKVKTDRLLAFAVEIPPWFRTLFDRLPPELARQQLTLLYRLVFPAPMEFVPPRTAATPAAKPGAKAPTATTTGAAKKDSGEPLPKEAKPTNTSQPF